MRFGEFHHPAVSLPVLRRRAGEELLEIVGALGEIILTRGRPVSWNKSFPNDAAYRNAVYRLRKAGLIASVKKGGVPFLQITADGRKRLGHGIDPEPYWNQRWTGVWYALLYDVPEKHRSYRQSLRSFLKRMRMGQLQRSVWLSPRDIRPEFDDMARAAGLRDYAYLFEFRATLGEPDAIIAERAWDFETLEAGHDWYCRECGEAMKRIARGTHDASEMATLARSEGAAFLRVMEGDPLLPRALWPDGYKGEEAWRAHREFLLHIKKRI